MENNLTNKAKYFAQHWGQKIGMMKTEQTVKFRISEHFIDKIYQIELKPLSSITDEDKRYVEDYCEEIQDEENDEAYIKWGDDFSLCCYKNGAFQRYLLIESYQYLQSKGYALPWMGLSVEKLIEYDWLKLKID